MALAGNRKRVSIAGSEERSLVFYAATPNGADSVYHVPRFKIEARCNSGLSGGASAKFAAGLLQGWPCGVMDRAIDAATGKERRVGRVNYCIDVQINDVAKNGADAITHIRRLTGPLSGAPRVFL